MSWCIVETDKSFNGRMQQYKKDLTVYKKWFKDNKKVLDVEEAEEKKQLRENITKQIKDLQKKLKQIDDIEVNKIRHRRGKAAAKKGQPPAEASVAYLKGYTKGRKSMIGKS